MSEYGNYTPASWAPSGGFTQARKAYAQHHAGRADVATHSTELNASKLLPAFIETKCTHPFLCDADFTGSMDGWDATFVAKYPYLEHEVRNEYLAKDTETSFGAFCDTADTHPLQIRPFAHEKKLLEEMKELVHASGGGGSEEHHEAHPLAMLYRIHNTRMPNAVIKPPYIVITDEMPCGTITVEQARDLSKVTIEKLVTRNRVIEQVMDRYSLYVILKPYGSERISGDTLPSSTQEVYDCWRKLIGADRIAILPDPNRVVDVIFGILAKDTGKIDYFRKEIEHRQKPGQVETVYKSLKTVHALPKPQTKPHGSSKGHSTTKGLGGGTPREPKV